MAFSDFKVAPRKPLEDFRQPLQFQPFTDAGSKAREDEVLRMLAEKRGRGGPMADPMDPSQRPPESSFLTQQGDGSPRVRAAALIRQKLRERMGGLPGEGMQTRMGG